MIKWIFPLVPHSPKTNGGQSRSSESTSSLQTSSETFLLLPSTERELVTGAPPHGRWRGVIEGLGCLHTHKKCKKHGRGKSDKCYATCVTGFIRWIRM
ncbi:hypothetical protein AVEN_227146-1 [Araneus ventricosus]|uniref:Uncharacterized protein n=1 Tax=Araneus ventricosus TaxID=182803 RepID=A0A4Y2BVE7_ARAVE|nr:hypothetical protein AVEN_227146-1 [Araneus ventricosus]